MSDAPYPAYTPDACCPKCHSQNIATVWGAENYYYWAQKDVKEHMRRMCRNCHYEWLESPLDAATPAREAGE